MSTRPVAFASGSLFTHRRWLPRADRRRSGGHAT